MTNADRNRQSSTDSEAVVRVEPKKSTSDAAGMRPQLAQFVRVEMAGTRPRHAGCAPCDGRWCDETCKLW